MADEPLHITLRRLISENGLAPILDGLGDQFPQYANDLHEVAERVEHDAQALIGKRRSA